MQGFKVSLHYTGTLLDGSKFDSSYDRDMPFEFQLGTGAVIRGFEMGVPTMKKGEKCLLTCRSDYAYGPGGSPPTIPPDATLNFMLEMLDWRGEDVSPSKTGEIERFKIKEGDNHNCPELGDYVEVHLEGRYNGRLFDERDLAFDIIEAPEFDVIVGVQIALEKMHRNETSRFLIKPSYAFGREGNEKFDIPPNATVEYTVTLKKFVSVGKVWKMSPEDLLSRAQLTKDKAVAYIKKERFQTALSMLNYAVQFLDKDSTAPEVNQLKLAVALNTALCHQKLNNHSEGKQSCNEALVLDPYNIKAYYRRGLFWANLWELEEAEADFKKVRNYNTHMNMFQHFLISIVVVVLGFPPKP